MPDNINQGQSSDDPLLGSLYPDTLDTVEVGEGLSSFPGLVFGTGTGCSATKSLAKLLKGTHEPFESTKFSGQGEFVDSHLLFAQRYGPVVSWRYNRSIHQIREKADNARFIAILRMPVETIQCFVNKDLFRWAGKRSAFIDDPQLPGWPPLNHWMCSTINIIDGFGDQFDDWEVVWIDELPGKKLNKSEPLRPLTGPEMKDIERFTPGVVEHMERLERASIERGRPLFDKIMEGWNA